ncbi:hypothetical protein IPZ59_18455 [Mongoliitalea daihaiensis]|nr:hypothetical protein IPZ59_18455 [Mongoliitalea daihaiensis]
MLKDSQRMTRTKQIVLTILTVSLLTGCDFIKNTFTYKDKTKEFVETLINEDYDKAIDQFAMEHEMARNTDKEAMKNGLADFRELVVKNFGTELNYSLMKSEKKFSTNEEENTPPNTTVALIEFSNDKEFGVFNVLFDDNSGKILNINTLDVKQPIPSMTIFWLFGLLAICIPIFNIYVIRQIKRSDLKKKWLKYIAVIFLNVPAITYAAVNGFSFSLLSFQILLGVSFGYMGFLNSFWTIGVPLGGLYWFWKLRQQENEGAKTEMTTEQKLEIETSVDNDKPTNE